MTDRIQVLGVIANEFVRMSQDSSRDGLRLCTLFDDAIRVLLEVDVPELRFKKGVFKKSGSSRRFQYLHKSSVGLF